MTRSYPAHPVGENIVSYSRCGLCRHVRI